MQPLDEAVRPANAAVFPALADAAYAGHKASPIWEKKILHFRCTCGDPTAEGAAETIPRMPNE